MKELTKLFKDYYEARETFVAAEVDYGRASDALLKALATGLAVGKELDEAAEVLGAWNGQGKEATLNSLTQTLLSKDDQRKAKRQA